MSDTPLSNPPSISAWLRASAIARPFLTAVCALSERLAHASVSLETDGGMIAHIEAPRRARLPRAHFSLESRSELLAACKAINAPESDAEALWIAAQTLQALFSPLAPELKSVMSRSESECLSLARSLPMDPNLPSGVERHGEEAQEALSDAIEEPATRQAILGIARSLLRPEHPLSQFAGALLSEADSEDISGAIESSAPKIEPLAEPDKSGTRSFARARSL